MTRYKLSNDNGDKILTAMSILEFNKKVSESGISDGKYWLTMSEPGQADIVVDATLAVRRILRGQE